MSPTYVRWVPCLVLDSLLLAFPLFLSTVSISLAGPPRPPADGPQFLDLNTATAEQLKTLPGIEDTYAEQIIKGRPYRGDYELVQRKIIPWTIYEQIKHKIVAK